MDEKKEKSKNETIATIAGRERLLKLGPIELAGLQDFLGRGPITLLAAGAVDFREAAAIVHFGLMGTEPGAAERTFVPPGAGAGFGGTLKLLTGMPARQLMRIANRVLLLGLGLEPPPEEDAPATETA